MNGSAQRVHGGDLAAILRETGALSGEEVRAIFARLCDAVGAAHASGEAHGALEPSNVLIGPRGGPGAPFTVEVRPDLQRPTSGWCAPEQAMARTGEGITAAADVWALGLLAFSMLTGRSYWRAGSVGRAREGADGADLLNEVTLGPLPPASERAVELGAGNLLPASFDAWFARCVARSTASRFRDARSAGVAFETIMMPQLRESSAMLGAGPRSRRATVSDSPAPRRILVIDDDRLAVLLVAHHLRADGYEVSTAGTGEEGLVVAQRVEPTLILLDFMLPDIDGPEVLRRLRGAEATRDVPVILLTGTELASHIAEGFRAGANDYLMKPVDVRLLSTRIEAAVATHERARRAQVIARRHQRLVADLEEARAEQEVTLSVLPAAWSGWWAVGGVAPSGMVGGDLIALYTGEGGERTAVVVDVAGHGAGAALVGASVHAALGLLLRRHSLADAFAALNEELTGTAAATRYACVAAVQVNGANVVILNAGLPPVCVARRGQPILEVSCSGIPPGLFPDQAYQPTLFTAEPGDRIAVVSDGLVEPFGFFDEALPILHDLGAFDGGRWTGGEQPFDVAELLRDHLARLAGPQPDDATLLLLEACGARA